MLNVSVGTVWNVFELLLFVLQRTVRFCEQLATVVPNAYVYYRRGLALKRIIPQCVARNFTYLMVINEDRKVPSILKVVLFKSTNFIYSCNWFQLGRGRDAIFVIPFY